MYDAALDSREISFVEAIGRFADLLENSYEDIIKLLPHNLQKELTPSPQIIYLSQILKLVHLHFKQVKPCPNEGQFNTR